jgi:ABC-type nitrate/sulfonate/bicarbonate transport system substrate-binding protein
MKMKRRVCFLVCMILALLSCAVFFGCEHSQPQDSLRVAIAPYQDIAMIVNIKKLDLQRKYGVSLELFTMPWEEIISSVASAGKTVDVGFCSLTEYLTKLPKLNTANDDPVLYIYPTYVFRGGGFISFDPKVPVLNTTTLKEPEVVKRFLGYRIGAQKNSLYEMMLFTLARRVGMRHSKLKIFDTTMNDGILAAQGGSLDIAPTGLTQQTEALKRGGHVVLHCDSMGIADITGFACKASTLKAKKRELTALIRMWFDCVNYMFKDMDKNAGDTLAYLDQNASTKYSLATYKRALTQEYFPKSVEEANASLVSPKGKYSVDRISRLVGQYLVDVGVAKTPPPPPKIIELQ